jgi:hypothetical protein
MADSLRWKFKPVSVVLIIFNLNSRVNILEGSALPGLVFAFSSPPSFKEGLGVVAFDFHQS